MPNAEPHSVSTSTSARGQVAPRGPDPARGREQRRRLALDRAEVVGLGALRVEGAAAAAPTSPSHSLPMVRASSPATSVPSEAAISEARASRKSPARMAVRFPHRALTLSMPRRVSASSMTSSW